MQLKLQERGDSGWNLATKSHSQSSKFTKLARFKGSEGLKPSQCFLTTWSHVYHGGLAPSRTGEVVCNRLPTAAECAFSSSACWFVLFMQLQLGTVEIYLSHCVFQE